MRVGFETVIQRITLILALALFQPAAGQTLTPVGDYLWRVDDPNFGGISGLSVTPNGNALTAITDRGWYINAEISRDGSAQISNVETTAFAPIKLGRPGQPRGNFQDSEGLVRAPDGTHYISFEGYHRIYHFENFGTLGRPLHPWDKFASLQSNSGFEALAQDKNGALYAIPERSGEWTRPFPVHRYQNGKWDQNLSIPRSERYLPTGADFGPDGKLYLLERAFLWYGGFSTRVRRFSLSNGGFVDQETILKTRPGHLDNMEGISVWSTAPGEIMITLVSDDNFNQLQSTRLVEYRLND